MASAPKNQSEPRRHHYVPRCWLAGFTVTGEKDGTLWVADLVRKKQWDANPGSTGFIKDFYRVNKPEVDPTLIEKSFSIIENVIGPLLRSLDTELREPNKDELDALLQFMALQFGRVPAFRPFALEILKSVNEEEFRGDVENPETWAAALEKAGIPADTPGMEYKFAVEAQRSGKFLNVDTNWYMKEAIKASSRVLSSLRKRRWNGAFSTSGSFIACDSPVILEGPRGKEIGFENATFVSYAVSRHVTLFGGASSSSSVFATRKEIASTNTLSLNRADQQIYSHVPDFCWLDEKGKYQTDWRLFSKERY